MVSSYECEFCGDSFEAYRDTAKYCSTECRDEARGGKYRNEEWLRQKYVEENMKVGKIAELADCASTTVHQWLNKHDIEQRGAGYRPEEPEKYRDKEWLEDKYHGERLSTSEIGDICDCSKQTIKLWLEKHNIEKRSRSEAAEIRAEKHPHTHGDPDNLREYNSWEIWDEEEREEFRERLSEQRKGDGNPMSNVTGEEHHHWKEETAPHQFYQTAEWKETRQSVLERDGNECQACGETEDLHVHHIQPVSAGGPRFEENNLVTLCSSCHKEWEGLYLRPDTR